MERTFLRGLFAVSAMTLACSAQATLVAYFPLTDGTNGSIALTADDVIDDPSHPITDATNNNPNTNDTWVFDATRNRIVLSTTEGSRFLGGTQGIDLNVDTGWTWSLWININSSNIADPGADSIIGTRNGGEWHKMDRQVTGNWNGGMTYKDASNVTIELADDTWHHLAYTGDATDRKIYLDGILVATDASIVDLDNNEQFEFGGSTRFSEYVTGLYSDIAVWNERLPEQRIIDLANGAPVMGNPAVPGDTDGDGDIDDTDLGTSFSNYTGPVGAPGGKTAADGDTDADGDVDDTDLGTSFSGYTGPLGPASVPEPTSLALLVLGGLALARHRRA